MEYDYLEAMVSDIKEWLSENDIEEVTEDNYDEIYEYLWIADSVTGNGSGSYTFNSYKASQYVLDNTDLAEEVIREYGIEIDNVYNWEHMDVSIRCYLLSQVLYELIEEE